MRKKIDGYIYDTESADKLGGFYSDEIGLEELMRTPKGRWFLHCVYDCGSKIRPLSLSDVAHWCIDRDRTMPDPIREYFDDLALLTNLVR